MNLPMTEPENKMSSIPPMDYATLKALNALTKKEAREVANKLCEAVNNQLGEEVLEVAYHQRKLNQVRTIIEHDQLSGKQNAKILEVNPTIAVQHFYPVSVKIIKPTLTPPLYFYFARHLNHDGFNYLCVQLPCSGTKKVKAIRITSKQLNGFPTDVAKDIRNSIIKNIDILNQE